MNKLEPFRLRARAPLIVAALVVPVIAAFALGGPPVGLAAGALAVAALLVVAARTRFDEPIEVASPPGDRYRVLLVALEDLDDPNAAHSLATAAREGARSTGLDRAPPEVLVLAPALNARVAHWLSDLDEARYNAQRRLAVSLASLSAAGVDARGQVGDSDPLQATEDVLRTFAAHEVTLVGDGGSPGDGRELLEEVRRRLDRPVRAI
jgi:hypothetical protein